MTARVEPSSTGNERPAASIVIRTKNEQALLGETLSRLQAQSVQDFELILVDSGSTDRTLEIARRFQVNIVEIPQREFTYGRALNLGSTRARGEVLVNLSAHCLPLSRGWLGYILGHFEDPQVAGVWGDQSATLDDAPSSRVYTQDLGMFLRDVYHGFSNANAAVRRALWQQRPWREDLPGSEDKEWAYWALSSGHRLVFDGRATVFHHHEESWREVWHRAHRESAGYAAFLDLPRFSAVDVLRHGYWQWRTEMRKATRAQSGRRAATGALPRLLVQQIGRYTGFRAGRKIPRVTGPRS